MLVGARWVRCARVLPVIFALSACATDHQPASGTLPPADRAMLRAIQAYYEHNAVEERNTCRSPIMDGVTRSQVLSRDGDETVVEVRYRYSNYVSRRTSNRRCTGFNTRTFTLTDDSSRPRVVRMTGEVRSSPSLRIW